PRPPPPPRPPFPYTTLFRSLPRHRTRKGHANADTRTLTTWCSREVSPAASHANVRPTPRIILIDDVRKESGRTREARGPSRRPDARSRRLGLPPAARPRPGKRGRDCPEAGRLAGHT